MSNFVTSTGLLLPTLAEIKTQLETDFQAAFGDNIDLSPEGPFGQFVSLMAKSISDAYLAAQEIYTARHPNEATGTSLDNISAETGVRRIDASATSVDNVVLYGLEGTTVPTGSLIKSPTSDTLYELDADVLISASTSADVILEPTDTTDGMGYFIDFDINGVNTSYNATTETRAELADAIVLEAQTTLATFIASGGVVETYDSIYVRVYHITAPFTTSVGIEISIDTIGTAGDFTCTTDGPNSAPASSLSVISTPVSGWEEVLNPEAGTTGRAVETDQELRIRRASTLNAGSATEEAIYAKLLNSVEGVTAVSVTSNRTLVTDGESRPPKSFEAVVEGGTAADVALTIWQNMPAGILSYGTDSEIITDVQGNAQTINFSRPTQQYLHVKVKRSLYSEEMYPVDGDDAIKQAIVDWSLTEYELGTDVIYQRIAIPVYSVEGVGSVEITVDLTNAPGDTPTFAANNIVVADRELVVAAVSRIIVEAL